MRLRQNTGITLQWIGWGKRGRVNIVEQPSGVYSLAGRQAGTAGASLVVDGVIAEVGKDYFVLDGVVAITDTPDEGRECGADKSWRFEVTQGRSYYRLREFEWCDGLTDYVDIYF